MAEKLNTLKKFKKINANFPFTDPIRQWKEKGGKVVAWGCNYVPAEIIYAADMLPVRLTGGSEEIPIEEATALMTTHSCSFARTCLELILKDEFNFLDGYVSANSCDGLRYLFPHIDTYHPFSFLYEMDLPQKSTPKTLSYYKREILNFKQEFEDHFQVKVTEDRLQDAIEIYNELRGLIKRLYELRKVDNPPIYGFEVLEVLNAAVRMPPKAFIDLVEELLQEIEDSQRELKGEARIMLVGPMTQSTEFVRGIEALGGLVVIDALRNGARHVWDMVDTTEPDPLEALSKRYLNQFPDPRMTPWEIRLNMITDLIKEYRVDGVIFPVIRYCVPQAYNFPILRNQLEEEGTPRLFLDVEYGMPATGQVRTRVQAFLEMIKEKKGE